MEDFVIDASAMEERVPIQKEEPKTTSKKTVTPKKSERVDAPDVTSCLRNEKIIIKRIFKENDGITDKKHPYYGGMAENSINTFTVPILTNGSYKNVLTNSEKAFLEEYMSMEPNALSVHNRENNYWENYFVKLSKQDTIFNLADPEDYIRYKVLLANNDYICPSLKKLREQPKQTYCYVVTSDSETYSNSKELVSNKIMCYKEFGKIEDNYDIMRTIIETIDGRPVSANSSIDFLRSKITDLIETTPREVLRTMTDPILPFRVLLNKAYQCKVVTKRGDYYYYNDEPLCNDGENPTASYAARYLSLPKNQELKLAIEAKIK